MKKERKKRKKKEPYFAEKEENAVIIYITSDSRERKNEIYNEVLREPFRKMTQSILRRYPIHIGNYDMELIEEEALTHLIEHMVKYRSFIIEIYNKEEDKWVKLKDESFKFFDIDKGRAKLETLAYSDEGNEYRLVKSKAFSYCQTIVRNYYKDHSKKSYTEKTINLSYDDYAAEIEENLSYEMDGESQHYLEKLINDVVKKMKKMIETNKTLKKNEVEVGHAIINVLENWHLLFMEETPHGKYNKKVSNKYAKNKVLFYLKEQTRLSTKEIRVAIKPFKELYFIEKMSIWDD